jgi:PAS domain S-box-containing protein
METEKRRREAESMIFASEIRYRRLFESAKDGILILDADTGIVENVNPYLLNALGLSRRQFVSRKIWELGLFADIIANQASFEELLKNEYVRYEDKPLRTADGRRLDVEFVSNVYMVNHKKVIQCNIRDITERKRAEDALLREKSLFNDLITTIPDNIYFKDRRSRFVRINASMARQFGLKSPADAVGKTDFDMHGEEHARQAYADEQRIMETGEPIIGLEEKETWPDGRVSWVSSTKVPLRDPDGRITGLVGVSRDITERKRAVEELRESEERFRSTFERLTVGMVHVGLDGHWLRVNQRFCDMVGYSEEELRRLTIFDLTHPDDLPPDRASMALMLEGKVQTYKTEKRYFRKDGSILPIALTVSLLRDPEGKPRYFMSVVEDITERRRAEEGLRKLSHIVEQAPLSIVITDLAGAIEYVNPRFCAVTGYTPQEAIGRNPRMLKSDQTPPETYRDMWRKLTRGEFWTGELWNRKKDGEVYVETAVISPVVDAAGRTTHYVALKDDITAQRRSAEEAAARIAKEREISEMKSRFISLISHEFRTPLTAAMAAAELLHNHIDRLGPAKRDELFGRINSSVNRLTEMLDDVLALNRVDTANAELRLVPVDLSSFMRDAMEEVRLGDRDSHRFELHCGGESAAFVTDTILMRHIVSNLLGNAARYSPAGTLITLRTDAGTHGLTMSVEDQGIGVPEADRQRIFEPFERGSNIGTTKGSGLGLNIVKRMTELLGGNVAVGRVDGGGSRFSVFLPRRGVPPGNP